MGDKKLKSCKVCYQDIDDRAIRCPYCRTYQNKFSFYLQHPAFILPIVVIPVLIVYIVVMQSTIKTFGPGKSFDEYKSSIAIKNSELSFGENNCGSTIAILGEIQNSSDVSWEDVQFEAVFYDTNGSMIDTGQDKKYSYILHKNTTSPFKFSIKREFPAELYGKYEIKVIGAKELDSVF